MRGMHVEAREQLVRVVPFHAELPHKPCDCSLTNTAHIYAFTSLSCGSYKFITYYTYIIPHHPTRII